MLKRVFTDPESQLAQRLQQRQALYPVIQKRIQRFINAKERGGMTSDVAAEASPITVDGTDGTFCRKSGVM